MNALRVASNLSRSTNNDIVRRCTNVSTIKDRIKELVKSLYENSMINNSDIQKFVRVDIAYPSMPLVFTKKLTMIKQEKFKLL